MLILRLVFRLGLRQAEGFASSVLRLLGLDLPVPDHTTLSRRGRSFANRRPQVVPHGPLHLLLDSTGLKLFGKGEWDGEKHGRARRSWRKFHLAVDAETGEIVASVLVAFQRPSGGGWSAKCPAHGDARNSLSIRHADGKWLLACDAGCTVAIAGAVGITVADLFDDNAGGGKWGSNPSNNRATAQPSARPGLIPSSRIGEIDEALRPGRW